MPEIPQRTAYKRQYRKDHKEEIKEYKKKWYDRNPERAKSLRIKNYANRIAKRLLYEAKRRAEKSQIPFSITEQDVVIPEFCPVLGLEIKIGKGKARSNSPSIDRMVPSLGYVKGNVKVISWRANRLKSDATLSELLKIVEYMKGS